MIAEDAAFADVAPITPYRPEEDAGADLPVRQGGAVTVPRVQVPSIMLPGIETGGEPAGAQSAAPVVVDGSRAEGWR